MDEGYTEERGEVLWYRIVQILLIESNKREYGTFPQSVQTFWTRCTMNKLKAKKTWQLFSIDGMYGYSAVIRNP
jgi:hypothetical protein